MRAFSRNHFDLSGIERRWSAKAEHLSPRYTTLLNEIVCIQT
ncbi:DUF4113 domain-containing protein [Terriglobus saanensis]